MRFDPLLPVPVLIASVAIVVIASVVAVRRGRVSGAGVARWSAMGVLLLIVAADPALRGGQAAVKRSDANVLFVVDTTGSMAAEDYNAGEPRLVGVRHDIAALADEFPGAHFSLVTFNSKTRVIVPWTTDRGALDSATQLLRQEWTLYAQGTRLDEPLPTMRDVLPRGGSTEGYDVVFFLSDGEQTGEPAPQSFEPVGDVIAGGAVLGYGTTDGARMHVYIGHDEDPEEYIVDDGTGADAVSRIDEANLVRIADELGVGYAHRTVPDGVGEIAGAAADGAGAIYSGERDTLRRLYWLPAFGLIALVLWQLARTALEIVDDRRMLDTRDPM
jgi:Ca-activated chloride channel family protein